MAAAQEPFRYDPYIYKHASRKPAMTPDRRRTLYEHNQLPLVDLPEGTLLFRAIKLTDDGMNFFMDTLGFYIPENPGIIKAELRGKKGYCLSPSQNVFTFPFPYVGFGLYDWEGSEAWKKYNAFIVYYLARSCPFVNMISPSYDVRGTPKGNVSGNSIVRCNLLGNQCFEPDKNPKKSYLSYDNCIDPGFAERTGTVGSISIAEQDSFSITKKGDNASLKKYYRGLEQESSRSSNSEKKRMREIMSVIKNTYVDEHDITGIPEIVLHVRNPRIENSNERPIQNVDIFQDAMRLFHDELGVNTLNVLPVALITGNKINYVGDSDFSTLLGSNNALVRKNNIEKNLREFMELGTREGLGEGLGKIIQDKRTGFYVLDKKAPKEYLDQINRKQMNHENYFIFRKREPDTRSSSKTFKTRRGGKSKTAKLMSVSRKSKTLISKKQGLLNKPKDIVNSMPIILPTAPEPVSEEALNNIGSFFAELGEVYAKMKRSSVTMVN